MAIYIKIEKIKTLENKHYYEVSTTNFGKPEPFFIIIDSEAKFLFVGKSLKNNDNLCSINLSSIETIELSDCILVTF